MTQTPASMRIGRISLQEHASRTLTVMQLISTAVVLTWWYR